MNQRKMGTTLSYLHIFLANTISILYTPYMLQMMGQSEYGLYGTASSFISYLSVLSFGIGGAYIRFNARCRAANDREGEKQLNGMFLTVFSVLALLVMAGGIGCTVLAERLVDQTFTPTELYKLRVIIVLLTVNMMISFVFNVVMMALNAYEKYIALKGMALATSILTPIANIIALKMGGRSIAITAISLGISIASYLFCFFYARKAIKMEFSFICNINNLHADKAANKCGGIFQCGLIIGCIDIRREGIQLHKQQKRNAARKHPQQNP